MDRHKVHTTYSRPNTTYSRPKRSSDTVSCLSYDLIALSLDSVSRETNGERCLAAMCVGRGIIACVMRLNSERSSPNCDGGDWLGVAGDAADVWA